MVQDTDQDLQELLQNVEALSKYNFDNPTDKRRAMLALRAASDKLQHPLDKIMEMWGHPSKDACLKVCNDVDLFSKWKRVGGVKSSSELAELSGITPEMMAPILRHLATWHMLNEEGPGLYSQTEFSTAMAKAEVAACVNLQFETFIPGMSRLPVYLKSTGYARPVNTNWSPFLYAMNAYCSIFEYFASHPECGRALDLTMRAYSEWKGSWLDIFPGNDLISAAKQDQCLLVDVGGSLGHDVVKFARRYPQEAGGRLVLQDQEHVLEGATNLPSSIRIMPHDFFTEQPVQGARAYYLHSILHDWNDEEAIRILKALKPAMDRASSKVLLHEIIIPPTNASMNVTTFDFIMMTLGSAKERTEEEWHGLIARAGLEVVKIWRSEAVVEGIIECKLP